MSSESKLKLAYRSTAQDLLLDMLEGNKKMQKESTLRVNLIEAELKRRKKE